MQHPRLRELGRVSLFSTLSASALASIAEVSSLQHFAAQSFLFREGEVSDRLFSIVNGRVVLSDREGLGEHVVAFAQAGETLQLPAILCERRFPLSAKTICDSLVLVTPASHFRKLIGDEAMLAPACALAVSQSWLALIAQLRESRSQTALMRLVRVLAEQSGQKRGPATFALRGTKRELAARVGIKPETLSRLFRKLDVHGVRTDGNVVRIGSLERMLALADETGPVPVSERRDMANPLST